MYSILISATYRIFTIKFLLNEAHVRYLIHAECYKNVNAKIQKLWLDVTLPKAIVHTAT
jgi:hypothetical protein